MPSVSILMPVYNGERFLREAIDSVLRQTCRDFELLILNDGSTDASRTIVNSYTDSRIRLIDNEQNRGLPATLNRGLAEASSGLIARQDADDLSFPTRLAKQVEFLSHHPDVALVGTQARFIDERGYSNGSILRRACSHDSIKWDLLFDNSFTHSSVMFRKEVIQGEFGGYDETFSRCEDYDLWSRVAMRHRVANLRETLVSYRLHPYARMSDRMNHLILRDNRRVVESNLCATFGHDFVSADDVDAVIGVRLMCQAPYVEQALAVIGRAIEHRKAATPVSSHGDSDFLETVACRYVHVANKARSVSIGCSWRVLAQVWRDYPVAWVSVNWAQDAAWVILSEIPRRFGIV
ncbi:MAG: putative glycosyltransferase EpsE [Nitrosomonadaceae bacterium]|nr:putative glycosyltransferase EpsE [Nitrosomonadaceae bacterium]